MAAPSFRAQPRTGLSTRNHRATPPHEPKGDPDDIWAKVIWAGLNLSHADLQAKASGQVRGRIVGAVS